MSEAMEGDSERVRLGAALAKEHARVRPGQALSRKEYERLAWVVREAVYDDIGRFFAQADYAALVHLRQLRAALQDQGLDESERDVRRTLLGYIKQQQANYRALAQQFERPIAERDGVHPAAAQYHHEVATQEPADLPLDGPCPRCGRAEVGVLVQVTGPLITDVAFAYGCGVCDYRTERVVTAQEQDALVRGLNRCDLRMVRRIRRDERL